MEGSVSDDFEEEGAESSERRELVIRGIGHNDDMDCSKWLQFVARCFQANESTQSLCAVCTFDSSFKVCPHLRTRSDWVPPIQNSQCRVSAQRSTLYY